MITQQRKQMMISYAMKIYQNKKQLEEEALQQAMNKYNHEIQIAEYEFNQGIKQIEQLP